MAIAASMKEQKSNAPSSGLGVIPGYDPLAPDFLEDPNPRKEIGGPKKQGVIVQPDQNQSDEFGL